jgi:hypothetical protein
VPLRRASQLEGGPAQAAVERDGQLRVLAAPLAQLDVFKPLQSDADVFEIDPEGAAVDGNPDRLAADALLVVELHVERAAAAVRERREVAD